MKKWIIYCEEKNQTILNTKGRKASFDDVIKEIEKGDFLILKKETKTNGKQKRFVVIVNNYPIEVPFNEREYTVQLITLFPNRKMK